LVIITCEDTGMSGIDPKLKAEIMAITAKARALKWVRTRLMHETPSTRAAKVDTCLGRLPEDLRAAISKDTETYRQVRSEVLELLPSWAYDWDLGSDRAA
jgi:hypothetical protein